MCLGTVGSMCVEEVKDDVRIDPDGSEPSIVEHSKKQTGMKWVNNTGSVVSLLSPNIEDAILSLKDEAQQIKDSLISGIVSIFS